MSEENKKPRKVRRVIVPQEVASMPLIAGQPDGPSQKYPYDFWMEWLLNTGFMFNSSNQGRRWATEIAIAYSRRKSDDEGNEYFDLEQKPPKQMWQALKHAAEHPGGEQQPVKYPIPGRYLGDYIDSIVEAEEVEVE